MKFQHIIENIQAVKKQHEEGLLQLANVVGVGLGFKEVGGQTTDQIAIIANVSRKLPLDQLDPRDVVPPQLEGVPTDVQEVGSLKPLEQAAAKEASFLQNLMDDVKELSQKWGSTLESYWPWPAKQTPTSPAEPSSKPKEEHYDN
ncbi:MAG TPA: hypothetical protein PKE64_09775 [Anaerolineae bacterium]|nr:hypothetical protein [Anaerolineae bacterium]HMR64286.1 hypothetical protein [Anaerolineae bacterium]